MKKYELIEHTADIGIRAFGKDLKELFANMAYALFDQVADLSRITCRHREKVILHADNQEELLIDWLNELLYLLAAKKLVFCEFMVTDIIDGQELRATVKGQKLGKIQVKEYLKLEVKAATYHGLKIDRDGRKFTAEVIFDV